MLSIEQCRELFNDEEQVQDTINSIWKSHWNNAKNTNDITTVKNLLTNHVRLFSELPERNNKNNRNDIIVYLQNKLIRLLKEEQQ
jgi:CRISPR/Cas system CSM-associated protein Csm2 small subunit